MVNIQSVIRITKRSVISFNSYKEYQSYSDNYFKNQPNDLSQALKLRKLSEAYSTALAAELGIEPEATENITAIFGSIQETQNRMKDASTKELLLNLKNRIVVEYYVTKDLTYIIATVHTRDDFEQLSTILNIVPITISLREP